MIKHGQEPFLECSTKGDKRFSAFCAKIKSRHNKSIEELYQAYKVFKDGSTGLSWKEAKGKKAVNQEEASVFYQKLWLEYLLENPMLIYELMKYKGLSDIFGQENHVCQATVLWNIKSNFSEIFEIDIKVRNIKNTKEGVYIGRPTILGNPFIIGKDGDRNEVVKKYKKWLWAAYKENEDFEKRIKELIIQAITTKSLTLLCYCYPEKCHGDVIKDFIFYLLINESLMEMLNDVRHSSKELLNVKFQRTL